jgi:hypothetical protein
MYNRTPLTLPHGYDWHRQIFEMKSRGNLKQPFTVIKEKKAAGPPGLRRFCFYQPADWCMNHLALRAFGTNV